MDDSIGEFIQLRKISRISKPRDKSGVTSLGKETLLLVVSAHSTITPANV